MTRKKYSLLLATTSFVCALSLVSISHYPTQELAQAQSVNQVASNSLPASLLISFRSPRTQGEPTESGSAGTRGGCGSAPDSSIPYLTPLTPGTVQGLTPPTKTTPGSTEDPEPVVEYPTLTVSEHPTFFVYIPQTSATQAEFVLKDKSETREIYAAHVTLSKTPGIVSVKLPTHVDSLEVGQVYKWVFSLQCPGLGSERNPTVIGWIERTEPNPALEKALDKAKPLELAALYGNFGIWHELLTTLADVRRSQPEDSTLTAIWENLLNSESVKLDAISQAPLVDSEQTPLEN